MGPLNHLPSNIVRRWLVLVGMGEEPNVLSPTSATWPVYAENDVDRPDNAIHVYSLEDILQGRAMYDGEYWGRHAFQVRIRGTTLPVAFTKADAVKEKLDKFSYQEAIAMTDPTNSYLIHSISRTSGPICLGNEPNTQRVLYTINASVSLRKVS